jgi:hypothetical protein
MRIINITKMIKIKNGNRRALGLSEGNKLEMSKWLENIFKMRKTLLIPKISCYLSYIMISTCNWSIWYWRSTTMPLSKISFVFYRWTKFNMRLFVVIISIQCQWRCYTSSIIISNIKSNLSHFHQFQQDVGFLDPLVTMVHSD